MTKKLNNLSLAAILGLGACSFTEDSKVGSGFPMREDETLAYSQPAFISASSNTYSGNLPYASNQTVPLSYQNQNNSPLIDYNQDKSTNLGPLEISVGPQGDSIRAKMPIFPATFEFPVENALINYRRNNLGLDLYKESFGYTPEISSFSSLGEFRDSYEEQILSTGELGRLGKFFKKYLFDNVRPLRDASEVLQSPITTVLGDNAKFEVFQRNDDFWAGLKFSGIINTKHPIDYEVNLQTSQEGNTVFSFDLGIIH